jgi:hypothetical protein
MAVVMEVVDGLVVVLVLAVEAVAMNVVEGAPGVAAGKGAQAGD